MSFKLSAVSPTTQTLSTLPLQRGAIVQAVHDLRPNGRIAQRLVEGRDARLVTGVNLPMLLRSVCYRAESLDAMAQRALAGGVQGVMPVASAAPQNQSRKVPHDQDRHDHHQ